MIRPTFPAEAYQVYRAFGLEMCNDGDQTPDFADALDTFIKAREAGFQPIVLCLSFDVAGRRFECAHEVTEEFETAADDALALIAAE